MVIEDDRKMACILQEAFQKQLHRVVLTSTGPDGLDVARSHQFEAIILDAMLPSMDGFSSISTPKRFLSRSRPV